MLGVIKKTRKWLDENNEKWTNGFVLKAINSSRTHLLPDQTKTTIRKPKTRASKVPLFIILSKKKYPFGGRSGGRFVFDKTCNFTERSKAASPFRLSCIWTKQWLSLKRKLTPARRIVFLNAGTAETTACKSNQVGSRYFPLRRGIFYFAKKNPLRHNVLGSRQAESNRVGTWADWLWKANCFERIQIK